MNIKQFLPILDWLPKYNKDFLKGDLMAGLTVGVMLVPQGMAYSLLAGLDPIYGLYASTIPLILYAIFGTSRQLAVGPVAMVALLIATGVADLTEADPTLVGIDLAITLALMVGVIQFLLGVFRMGFLVNFLSHPVISGFTSAAALIIGFSQLKHVLGVKMHRSHHVTNILSQAYDQIKDGNLNYKALFIAVVAMTLILIGKKINKSIPGPLVAVIFGIGTVMIMGWTGNDLSIVKDVPAGLPSLKLPSFDNMEALFPIAMTISLIGFMESIAVAKAIQNKHKDYEVSANQELIGLGIANIGGSMFQSFPVTGGFSRTAVNDQAGAKSGMAAIISAVLIGITLMFFTGAFYDLPKAILGAIIMVAVVGLIDIKEALHLWKTDKRDFLMLIITFLATLSIGVEAGIGLGVVLSLMMLIFRTTKPHFPRLGNIPGTTMYRNISRFEDAEERPEILIVRFDAQLYFANVTYFKDRLYKLINRKGDALRCVIIDSDSMNNIDSSGVHALGDIIDDLTDKNIKICFVGLKGPVRDVFYKAHLMEKIGKESIFFSIKNAIKAFDGEKVRQGSEKFSLQTFEEE